MVIVSIIHGDLLNTQEKYIAQQCNCVTIRAHGLSQSIAQKYPYANVYNKRASIGQGSNCAKKTAFPGTIDVCYPTDHCDPTIICMYAQYCPGKVGIYQKYYPKLYTDSVESRLQWFDECLTEIEKLGITRIAMPYLIGCGLAGGKWNDYKQKLEHSKLEIVLYQL